MPSSSELNPEFFGAVPVPRSGRRDLSALRMDHALEYGMMSRVEGPARRSAEAHLIDAWLRDIWGSLDLPPRGIALMAHGSLGRRDLGPLSPFDIALVWDDASRAMSLEHAPEYGLFAPTTVAQQVWYPLWEAGASFTRATMSLTQCALAAAGDVEQAIPLLDLRFVAGDEVLAETARTAVHERFRAEMARRWDEVEDVALRRGRHYPSLVAATEPNLIQDRGGLRDASLIRAIVRGLPEGVSWQGSAEHMERVRASASLLRDVRDALQTTRRRASGRLLTSDVGAVAGLTGYLESAALLADVAHAGLTLEWELERVVRIARGFIAPAPPESVPAEAAAVGLAGSSGELGWVGSANAPRDAKWPNLVPRAPRTLGELLNLVRVSAVSGWAFTGEVVQDVAAVARELNLAAPGALSAEPVRQAVVELAAAPHALRCARRLEVDGALDAMWPTWQKLRLTERQEGSRSRREWQALETAHLVARECGRIEPVLAAVLAPLGPVEARERSLLSGLSEDASREVEMLVEHVGAFVRAAERGAVLDGALPAHLADATGNAEALRGLAVFARCDARARLGQAAAERVVETIDFLTRSALAILEPRGSGKSGRTGDGQGAQGSDEEPCPEEGRGVDAHALRLVWDTFRRKRRVSVVLAGHADDGGHLIAAFADDGRALTHVSQMAAQYGFELVSGHVETREAGVLSAWLVRPRGATLPHPSVLRAYLAGRLGQAAKRVARATRHTAASPNAAPTSHDTIAVHHVQLERPDVSVLTMSAGHYPRFLQAVAAALDSVRVRLVRCHVVRLGSQISVVLYVSDGCGRALSPQMVGRLTEALAASARFGTVR